MAHEIGTAGLEMKRSELQHTGSDCGYVPADQGPCPACGHTEWVYIWADQPPPATIDGPVMAWSISGDDGHRQMDQMLMWWPTTDRVWEPVGVSSLESKGIFDPPMRPSDLDLYIDTRRMFGGPVGMEVRWSTPAGGYRVGLYGPMWFCEVESSALGDQPLIEFTKARYEEYQPDN